MWPHTEFWQANKGRLWAECSEGERVDVMTNLWKGLTKDRKGFSLVELICAVAILSIVILGVGTSMVVSARSYSRGNTELDLQQQAQITANLLTNLIIDADAIVEPSTEAGGTRLEVTKMETVGDVSIWVTYVVAFDEASQKLNYYRDGVGPELLAEHISEFTIKRVSGNNIDFTLGITENGRDYNSDYHVTPRNNISNSTFTGITSNRATIFAENRIVLEPGQEYELNVNVANAHVTDPIAAPFRVEDITGVTDLAGTKVTIEGTNIVKIKVGLAEKGSGVVDTASFRFVLRADHADELPVEVLVRRVTDINVQGQKLNGNSSKAGAIYNVTARTAGSNLARVPGAWYDLDYVPTYPVFWELQGEGLPLSVGHYAKIMNGECFGDINEPFCKVQLLQDIPNGGTVKVVAVAKHPEGTYGGVLTNKSGLEYGTVLGEYTIKNAVAFNRGERELYVPFSFKIGDLGQLKQTILDLYFNTFQDRYVVNNGGTTWRDKNLATNEFNALPLQSYVQFRYTSDVSMKAEDRAWTDWIALSETGATPILTNIESGYFKLDQEYILQVKVSLVNANDKTDVYWPFDGSSRYDNLVTPEDEYLTEYFVNKMKISDIRLQWWDYEGHDVIADNTTTNIKKDTLFTVRISEVIGYGRNNVSPYIHAKVEKRDTATGVWAEDRTGIEGFYYMENGEWKSRGASLSGDPCFINVRTKAVGEYRITFYMDNVPYIAPGTVDVTMDSCEFSDKIIYLNIID